MGVTSPSSPATGMVREIHGSYRIKYHPVEDEPDKVGHLLLYT